MKSENLNFPAKYISLKQLHCWNQWVPIMTLSWYVNFLQNDVKYSDKPVSAANYSGKYTLGTLDGMFV